MRRKARGEVFKISLYKKSFIHWQQGAVEIEQNGS
jgi:hypothetical protein